MCRGRDNYCPQNPWELGRDKGGDHAFDHDDDHDADDHDTNNHEADDQEDDNDGALVTMLT